MDRIIQDNTPLFLLVWVGSVFLMIAAAFLNAPVVVGVDRWLLFASVATYLLGV